MHGLCGLCLLVSAMPGLCTPKLPDYPVRQPNEYKVSVERDGVSIGLEPVESVQDQMTYFHSALSPKGFLPVFVVIHNASKLDSLLLDKSAVTYALGNPNGEAPKEMSGEQKAGILGVSAIPFVGVFIAAGMSQDAADVKQNLMLRELQSGTLSPGDTVHGFLYIPIPKKGPRPRIHIHFPIAWTGSDQPSVLSLDF